MLKAYSKFLDKLEKIERVLLTLSMGVMTIIIIYQVILRYIFNRSNSWSEEMARYLMVFSTMTGAAIAVRRNSHLQIDVFINYFKPQMKRVFTTIATLIGIGFLIYLLVYSIRLCGIGLTNNSAGIGIPMMIPYAFIPFGVVLMILASIEVILKNINDFTQHKTGEENS